MPGLHRVAIPPWFTTRGGVLGRQPSQVETPFLILRRLSDKRVLRGLRVPLNPDHPPELIPGYHPLTVQPQAMPSRITPSTR